MRRQGHSFRSPDYFSGIRSTVLIAEFPAKRMSLVSNGTASLSVSQSRDALDALLNIRINPPYKSNQSYIYDPSPSNTKQIAVHRSSKKIKYPENTSYSIHKWSRSSNRHHTTNPGCLLHLYRRLRNSPPCLYHSLRLTATRKMVTRLPLSYTTHSRAICLGRCRLHSPNQQRSAKRNGTHCLVQPPRPPQLPSLAIRSSIFRPRPG